MVLKVKISIKDELSETQKWGLVDDMKVVNSVVVYNDDEKYELKYITTKSGIRYGSLNSLYELSRSELESLICNSYKKIELGEKFKLKEIMTIIKKINDLNVDVIPMDREIYIKTESDMIELNGERMELERIVNVNI